MPQVVDFYHGCLSGGGAENVYIHGARGDGSESSAAFRSAIDAAVERSRSGVGTGEVIVPNGAYKLSEPVYIPGTVQIVGVGYPTIEVAHDGTGFILTGIPEPNVFPRTKVAIRGVRFSTDHDASPAAVIQNGQPGDGESPTYLHSQNSTEITNCAFDGINADCVFVNQRGFNVTFNGCQFNDCTVSDAVVRLLQSPSDTPNWSFAFNIQNCDFTNIRGAGTAIKADSGDVRVFGGVIEGCAGDAVILGANTNYPGNTSASFHGVYFEANTGDHVRCAGRAAIIGFFGSKFVSGGCGNSFTFHSASEASFYGCATPNNACAFDGGNIHIHGSAYIVGAKTDATNVITYGRHHLTTAPQAPHDLGARIKVNGESATAAVVLCTHYSYPSGAPNGTVAELFLVRLGTSGGRFEALSLGRAQGNDTAAFVFSVDEDGYLQVSSDTAGTARYQIIASNTGAFLPL